MNTEKINNAVARAIILYSSNYLSLSLVADFYSAIKREFRISNDEFKEIEKNVHEKLDMESSNAYVMPIWVFEEDPKNKADYDIVNSKEREGEIIENDDVEVSKNKN